jgi:hypothetical protein
MKDLSFLKIVKNSSTIQVSFQLLSGLSLFLLFKSPEPFFLTYGEVVTAVSITLFVQNVLYVVVEGKLPRIIFKNKNYGCELKSIGVVSILLSLAVAITFISWICLASNDGCKTTINKNLVLYLIIISSSIYVSGINFSMYAKFWANGDILGPSVRQMTGAILGLIWVALVKSISMELASFYILISTLYQYVCNRRDLIALKTLERRLENRNFLNYCVSILFTAAAKLVPLLEIFIIISLSSSFGALSSLASRVMGGVVLMLGFKAGWKLYNRAINIGDRNYDLKMFVRESIKFSFIIMSYIISVISIVTMAFFLDFEYFKNEPAQLFIFSIIISVSAPLMLVSSIATKFLYGQGRFYLPNLIGIISSLLYILIYWLIGDGLDLMGFAALQPTSLVFYILIVLYIVGRKTTLMN